MKLKNNTLYFIKNTEYVGGFIVYISEYSNKDIHTFLLLPDNTNLHIMPDQLHTFEMERVKKLPKKHYLVTLAQYEKNRGISATDSKLLKR
jgi:hypothetical protein